MKKSIKRTLITIALALPLFFLLAACGSSKSSSASSSSASSASLKTVRLGIMGSDDRIWKAVGKVAKKKYNIDLKLTKFTDYNQPNAALSDGSIDLNAFQHQFFLDNWNKAHKSDIVSIGETILAPIRLYSQKIKSVKDFKKGDEIAIPNDATNEGRALNVLATIGLIKLDNKALPTTADIKENKLGLKITALDAAQTARALSDVTAAVVNDGVANDAKLDPNSALYVEKVNKKSEPYINIIAANKKDAKNKTYLDLVKAYQTEATKKLLKEIYKGADIPAWDITLK
ncbi:MetQ/NlpA family ABC transporter substrate-binding protein [Schleiferilactobacillus harbinensis]|uniref:Lipoprotein n=1 Tax=Schleiferilactobacillus harbinensis TaxID=304207 RepID=A0ABU7SYR2_9LACO